MLAADVGDNEVVDKYDDDNLIGLCVKDQVHQCTFPPLLLCKRTNSSNLLFVCHF